jgi:hypothetical protein
MGTDITTTTSLCRLSNSVADDDLSTCRFAEFSSKWRTRFSHLRGGSENQTIVQESARDDGHDKGIHEDERSVASLGVAMPARSVGVCDQSSDAMVELGGGPDTSLGTGSEVLFGAFNSKRVSHERCVAILRWLLLSLTKIG